MCGIAGYLGGGALDDAAAGQLLQRMGSAIAHRGPDSTGNWQQADARIGLAHRRLAIVDLSPAGHQPMRSHGARHTLVFNGEIYNHLALRAELGAGIAWRGHSDTETLLACIEAWGVRRAVERAHGMFAFAVWDHEQRRLTLARDRLGEKPLYYGWHGRPGQETFLFGSELRALQAHPDFRGDVDRDALQALVRHGTVGGTRAIWRGIRKLPPASLLSIGVQDRPGEPTPQVYWSAATAAADGCAHPLDLPPAQAVDALEALLRDAVRRQMLADVPLGAFLSGGVDSSTVTALMQVQSRRPVRSFSIGFREDAYDESRHARRVAQHLGTEHTEFQLGAEDALAVVPRLASVYDEPFADSSQIPTLLVSTLARRHVTVCLSGDGGDELFCGYNRHLLTHSTWPRVRHLPLPLRRLAAAVLLGVPPQGWDSAAAWASRLSSTPARWAHVGEKLHKAGLALDSGSVAALHRRLTSTWHGASPVLDAGSEPDATPLPEAAAALGEVQQMQLLDQLSYLPDDILAKVDRAAMSVSLETRVPLLDHRVAEFAWRLPQACKLRAGPQGLQTKWALRQVLYRHVPPELIERPKMGFGVPLGAWLRGPLRAWAEELLDESRLRREGWFDAPALRRKWALHQGGRFDCAHQLWPVLVFQAWLQDQDMRKAAACAS